MSKQGVAPLRFSEEIHIPERSVSDSFCFSGFSQNVCEQRWQQTGPRAFLWQDAFSNRLVMAQGTAENVYVSGQK